MREIRFRRFTEDEMGHVAASTARSGAWAGYAALWDVILGDTEGTTYTDCLRDGHMPWRSGYAIPADQHAVLYDLLRVAARDAEYPEAADSLLVLGPAGYSEGGPAAGPDGRVTRDTRDAEVTDSASGEPDPT